MSQADDADLVERARQEQRVLISADTDFGELLASLGSTVPSVILYRGRSHRHPTDQVSSPDRQPARRPDRCIIFGLNWT